MAEIKLNGQSSYTVTLPHAPPFVTQALYVFIASSLLPFLSLPQNAALRVSTGSRNVVCVMVVLVFVAFNFGPVSFLNNVPEETMKSPEISHHTRHLLTYQSEADTHPSKQKFYKSKPATPRTTFRNSSGSMGNVKHLMVRDLDQLFLTSDCRHFNRTESLRLVDELSLWVRRHQNDRKTGKKPPKKQRRMKKPLLRRSLSLSDLVPAQPSRLTH
ncbi:cyclic AMP-dependent transcription factor ATF-6 beta-like, partial [Bombina bombina]|uniref:cyclic AMP-dependent transcription factor ATF-6 beta-like n=1 Tax=Bombina bombina TaxID=8345 RepID=UPI00235A8803